MYSSSWCGRAHRQNDWECPPRCFGHIQRKNDFKLSDTGQPAGCPVSHFHQRGRKGKRHLQRLFPTETAALWMGCPLDVTSPFVKKQFRNARRRFGTANKNILSALYAQSTRGGHSKSFYLPASSTASTAFWTWRRFSASSKISSACCSNRAVEISSPRWAGRQCSTSALGFAFSSRRPVS